MSVPLYDVSIVHICTVLPGGSALDLIKHTYALPDKGGNLEHVMVHVMNLPVRIDNSLNRNATSAHAIACQLLLQRY